MSPFTQRPSPLSPSGWFGVGLFIFGLTWAVNSLIEVLVGRLPTPPWISAINFSVGWVALLLWLNSRVRRHAPRVVGDQIEIRHQETGTVLLLWPDETMAGLRLSQAQLRGANLSGLDLCEAELPEADLRDAYLHHCDLSHADLREVDLRGALLQGADLQEANLCGTDLQGAQLVGTRLAGARYDAHTRWPQGIDPIQQRCVLVQPEVTTGSLAPSDAGIQQSGLAPTAEDVSEALPLRHNV